ncbi:MAG: AraC family transcriptional regulator [Meiothermus sp.]|nr:AraC family transcriptional regulator [Meiothermus sp.]
MLLTEYAQVSRVGHSPNAPHSAGWPNVILHARGRDESVPEHATSAGLFTAVAGLETHRVGLARFAVTPERYLLLNDGVRHAHGLEGEGEVLSVRFRTGLAADVYTAAASPDEEQLEHPERRRPVRFYERTYPRDPKLQVFLGLLRAFTLGHTSQDALDQALHPVLELLLRLHRGLDAEIERLPAARRSTREELYRRLHLARDYMESSFLERPDLDTLAGLVELSPHHFLRLFKAQFGLPPYQYLVQRRLRHAAHLLRTTGADVTDVCFDLGFESLGSFSRSFKEKFGVSPSSYRAGG